MAFVDAFFDELEKLAGRKRRKVTPRITPPEPKKKKKSLVRRIAFMLGRMLRRRVIADQKAAPRLRIK